eukprot:CAMPEP_0181292342 /NCGR_PEP_ID=MMETSP1101-20121128/2456_1 /TAXON_ID=46948 /ORGANISM="Rhodomonas abbreviata, Strain Caron Lab Isolate" /LENGTH=174 /DNA_ID=CAMNT_0023396807 /DNA_START=837 /DNA_END=1359 /DNA_ORIENTATION=-
MVPTPTLQLATVQHCTCVLQSTCNGAHSSIDAEVDHRMFNSDLVPVSVQLVANSELTIQVIPHASDKAVLEQRADMATSGTVTHRNLGNKTAHSALEIRVDNGEKKNASMVQFQEDMLGNKCASPEYRWTEESLLCQSQDALQLGNRSGYRGKCNDRSVAPNITAACWERSMEN